MDDRTFDTLAKTFASRQTRRSLLRNLLGIGGAATVAAVASRSSGSAQIAGPGPQITPIPICPPSRMCGTDCCGLSETCCNGVCCSGAEQCCDPPGTASPICLPDDACCSRSDCKHLDDLVNCTVGVCNQQTHACEAVDGCGVKGLAYCPGKPRGACYDPKSECCPECETGSCLTCSGGQCTGCEQPESCCVNGDVEICLDLTLEGSCCTSADCGFDDPSICQVSVCRDWVCEPASECLDGETCCVIGDARACLDMADPSVCCTAADCGLEDADNCLVSLCADFTCHQISECTDQEQCCGTHTCVPIDQSCP